MSDLVSLCKGQPDSKNTFYTQLHRINQHQPTNFAMSTHPNRIKITGQNMNKRGITDYYTVKCTCGTPSLTIQSSIPL